MTALRLRIAAEVIERLERAEGWCVDSKIAANDVRVTWAFGGACLGHKELCEAVSEIVGERIEEFRAEAIRRLKARAASALKEAGVEPRP